MHLFPPFAWQSCRDNKKRSSNVALMRSSNFDPHLRNKPGFARVIAIQPGSSKAGERQPDFNYVVELMREHSEQLLQGVRIYNAHLQRVCLVKGIPTAFCPDYRCAHKRYGLGGAPQALACHQCWFRGVTDPAVSKMLYVGHHVFLPPGSTLFGRISGFRTTSGVQLCPEDHAPRARCMSEIQAGVREPLPVLNAADAAECARAGTSEGGQ